MTINQEIEADMKSPQEILDTIIELLDNHGDSRKHMARELNIPFTTINNMHLFYPKSDNIFAISRYLNVPIDKLMSKKARTRFDGENVSLTKEEMMLIFVFRNLTESQKDLIIHQAKYMEQTKASGFLEEEREIKQQKAAYDNELKGPEVTA